MVKLHPEFTQTGIRLSSSKAELLLLASVQQELSNVMGKPIIREPGQYKGQIVMADDFDAPLEEFKEYL